MTTESDCPLRINDDEEEIIAKTMKNDDDADVDALTATRNTSLLNNDDDDNNNNKNKNSNYSNNNNNDDGGGDGDDGDDTDTTKNIITTIKSGMKNTELTTKERLIKKQLKSHLKQQIRLKKYETRYCQAIKRQDKFWIERSKREYEDYYQSLIKQSNSVVHTPDNTFKQNLLEHLKYQQKQQPSTSNSSSSSSSQLSLPQNLLKDELNNNNNNITTSTMEEGKEEEKNQSYNNNNKFLVEEIWNPLRSIIFASSNKIEETTLARNLLQNMTKGTQTKTMFKNNHQALLGYTRHKFLERSNLAFLSLHRYYTYTYTQSTTTTTNNNNNNNDTDDDDDDDGLLLLLQPPLPNQIWSIGCGPGCDAAGIVSYYYNNYFQRQSTKSSSTTTSMPIQRLVLMDFVMDEWNEICVNELIPLIKNKCNIPTIETSICDVSHPLFNSTINKSALSTILNNSESIHVNDNDNNNNDNNTYLVVVSYLLTETRGRWYDFFYDVITKIIPPGSMLLLSEPTAWQLHIFLDKFHDYIHDHIWLDSSMNTPNLQKLENRIGPAVVMVRTKTHTHTQK